MHWVVFVLCIIILPTIFAGLAYFMLIRSVKKEVKQAPKVPMTYCDKHGMFPSKHAMKINVPTIDNDQAPLAVEMCPFCVDQKLKAAEKVFKT